MKNILKLLLVVHITILFLLNLIFFSKLNSKPGKNSLNKFGQYLFYLKVNMNETLFKVISIYGSYVGTSRSYEYFSPNIPPKDFKFVFITDANEKVDLLQSNYETNVKMMTFDYLFSF